MLERSRMRGEAVVVGAGPAGLSAALALARSDVKVTVLEQHATWPGRVCGGFLNPEGVRHLRSLEALDAVIEAGGVPVTHARVTTAGGVDRTVSVTAGGTSGLGVPRRALEQVLIEHARTAGAAVRMGLRVTGLQRAEGRWTVTGRHGAEVIRLAADLLVMGDGRFSMAIRPGPRRRAGWFGWNATFSDVPQSAGELSMHFLASGYVGVLTFSDGSTNVCGLTLIGEGRPQTWEDRWADVVSRQPALARLMAGARRVSEWRGVGPLPFSRSMRESEGPILAGDAAAVGDPYMGEGISRALGTGTMLLEVLGGGAGGALDGDAIRVGYERIWRRRYTARLKLGTAARRLQRRAWLFHALLGAVARQPLLMRSLTRVFHPGGSA